MYLVTTVIYHISPHVVMRSIVIKYEPVREKTKKLGSNEV